MNFLFCSTHRVKKLFAFCVVDKSLTGDCKRLSQASHGVRALVRHELVFGPLHRAVSSFFADLGFRNMRIAALKVLLNLHVEFFDGLDLERSTPCLLLWLINWRFFICHMQLAYDL